MIHVPVDFEDREALEELLSEKRKPQGGDPHAAARQKKVAARPGADRTRSTVFDAALPRAEAVVARPFRKRCRTRLNLPEPPTRIECFDISHIQGTDKVASMVVWEDGKMKKADYRKFIIRTVIGNDDFASMREVVTRRYSRLQEEKQPMPGLVLIDGGLGQLHAAAEALESLGIINQPLASIAKREEIIYVYGQEDEPVVLDRFSPILHLVQSIRDEAHRFAVTFHRTRRQCATARPNCGDSRRRGTAPREAAATLWQREGRETGRRDGLSAVVTRSQAEAIRKFFRQPEPEPESPLKILS